MSDAVEALLSSKELDGMFIAAGISLPAATELIGSIPHIDPLLLHNVRCGRPSGRSFGQCSSPAGRPSPFAKCSEDLSQLLMSRFRAGASIR